MPINVRCYFGETRAKLPGVGITPAALGNMIEQAFLKGSDRGTQFPPNIQITASSKIDKPPLLPNNAPRSHKNHLIALRNLIGTQQPGQPRKVGLVFTDYFLPKPEAYGYMIDGGVSPTDPHGREGAIVCVSRILADRRKAGPSAVRREFLFTCVHELGHVFNLWHVNSEMNYMATSGAFAYPLTAHRFVNGHRAYMRLSSKNAIRFLAPGGSEWGKRPKGFPAHGDPQNRPRHKANRGRQGLRLAISVEPTSFHAFEPIELDLQLSCSRGKRARVPDELDPGYDAFAIWIERPNGERFRYRPTKRFMETNRKLELASARPFRRDISIFAQRGGYTFHESGIYRITVTFDIGRSVLESNTEEVEVREHTPSKQIALLEETVPRTRILDRLYYREGPLTRTDEALCHEIVECHRRCHFAAALRYAAGRHEALRLASLSRPPKAAIDRCVDYLRRAADLKSLSSHRKRRAEEVADSLRDGSLRAKVQDPGYGDGALSSA